MRKSRTRPPDCGTRTARERESILGSPARGDDEQLHSPASCLRQREVQAGGGRREAGGEVQARDEGSNSAEGLALSGAVGAAILIGSEHDASARGVNCGASMIAGRGRSSVAPDESAPARQWHRRVLQNAVMAT